MAAGFGLPGLIVPVLLLWRSRRAQRILRTGISGVATIRSLRETGVRINDQPRVELELLVRVGTRAPYVIQHKQVVPTVALPLLLPGASIRVKVDPEDPKSCLIEDLA